MNNFLQVSLHTLHFKNVQSEDLVVKMCIFTEFFCQQNKQNPKNKKLQNFHKEVSVLFLYIPVSVYGQNNMKVCFIGPLEFIPHELAETFNI